MKHLLFWPIDGANLKPRGGTPKGPPVTVDTEPSAEWRALQAPGLTPLERADAWAMGVESGG